MDIILERAKQFADNYFHNIQRNEEIFEGAKKRINSIDDTYDRIKFINYLIERINADYSEHNQKCRNPDCKADYNYKIILYEFSQWLKRLGVKIDEDTFTAEEKLTAEGKLEQILKDIQDIKLGQQVTYDDIIKELNELQELFFLGKKKWYQLLIGKGVDMAVSGIVSETISKQIIDDAKNILPKLIG